MESWLSCFLREPQHAYVAALQALAIDAEHGFPYVRNFACTMLGWAQAQLGRAGEGVALIRQDGLPRRKERKVLAAGTASESRRHAMGLLADGQPGAQDGRTGAFSTHRKGWEERRSGYALVRFDNEVHRIYGVMNLGLHKKKYLAAGQYTIADMICYPWATTLQNRNIDLGGFPNVKR
jgi:glutathione S-transferase